MAKRMTDSKKWHDPWLLNLPLKLKFLWIYILDECDHAGFWKINMSLVSFHAGEKITEEEMLTYFGDRIQKCGRDKIWIRKFIEYQYGKKLNPSSKIHQSVINILEENNMFEEIKGFTKGCQTLIDKDKDKNIDKEYINNISNQFRKEQEFTDWPKQIRCIKSFIKKCNTAKISPEYFMKEFKKLQEKHTKYADLPFSPSILSSWFDSALILIRKNNPQNAICEKCGATKIKEYGKTYCPKCDTS